MNIAAAIESGSDWEAENAFAWKETMELTEKSIYRYNNRTCSVR